MSLETVIEANTKAVSELTAAILGNKGATAGGGKTGNKAAAETKTGPAHNFEEVTKKCIELKTAKGDKIAQEIIKEFGKAPKLKEVAEANYDALFDAADAKLKEEDEL